MASITVQTPYNEYTGNGSATVYAYTFLLLAASDLVVKIDGTTTTAYTLSGIGASSGGNVTFTTAPASGATVLISREIPLSRSIEYQTNGDFRASTVNLDFNRLWQYLQLAAAKLGAQFRAPYPEQVNEGPSNTARRDRLLAFHATTGQPKASDLTETQLASVVAAAYTGAAGPLDALSFIQAGAGAVSRTAQAKAREMVSLADFGAVGDGATDDREAIVNALATNKPLEWVGTVGKNFRINLQISHTPTADVIWSGQGATLTYAGAHAEFALRLNDATGVEFIINNLTIDGAKLCNKVLEVLNNTSLSTPSEFSATNLYVRRAKRSNSFSGGEGIRIRGAFNRVLFNGGGVSDCELPAGQGTSGVIGIAGVGITEYGTTSYVRECVVNSFRVEKIYSSDLAYNDDQDGFVYFAPTDGTRKVPSTLTVTSGEFVNCYGRSIKTQCRNTVVQANTFIRSEGLARGFGNAEIDAQTGNGTFRDNSFSYTNAQEPGVCMNVSGSHGTPGMIADNNSVVLDNATTLSVFAEVYPSGGLFSRHAINNNKVFGKVKEFFSFNANSNKNYADVSGNYVGEIVNGVTSQKALIYVRASGASTPYFANVITTGNIYDNTHAPALVRDAISGSSMSSALSAWHNCGFMTDDVSVNPGASGLKTNAIVHVDKIGPSVGDAYARVVDLNIPGSSTVVVDVGNEQGALLFAQMKFTQNSFLFFASSGTTNAGISVGSDWAVGNSSDPGSGTFRVWSSGTRQLTFRNTNASARAGVLMILSPGS